MNLVPPSLSSVVAQAKELSVAHAELSHLLQKREEFTARAARLSAEVAAMENTVSVEDTEKFRTLLEKRLQLEITARDTSLADGAIPAALARMRAAHLAFIHAGKGACVELDEAVRHERSVIIQRALAPFNERLDAATEAARKLDMGIRDSDFVTREPAEMVRNSGRLLEAWAEFTKPGLPSSAAETSAALP